MTHVIAVPPSLDDHSFEQVLEQLAPLPADAKVLVDARHVRWASPYGLTALLTLAQTRSERPALAVPEAVDATRIVPRQLPGTAAAAVATLIMQHPLVL